MFRCGRFGLIGGPSSSTLGLVVADRAFREIRHMFPEKMSSLINAYKSNRLLNDLCCNANLAVGHVDPVSLAEEELVNNYV